MENEKITEKRIREKALELFSKKSFEEVTLNEICEASGVNKHTFYYYFKSKDDLLKKYYKIPYKVTSNDLTTILNADSYVEQLWLLNKNYIDFVVDSGVNIMKQIIIKNLSKDVGTFKISDEKKEIFKLQRSIIEKAQASGQIRNKAEAKTLIFLFIQSMHANVFLWIMRNGQFDFHDIIRYNYEAIFDVSPEYRKCLDFPLSSIFE
jgi:AcrR family transcriptional regulator